MTDQRGYRQRRLALAAAAIALIAIGHRERPTFGTISITMDAGKAPTVTAALAPPLDTVAAFVAVTMEKILD